MNVTLASLSVFLIPGNRSSSPLHLHFFLDSNFDMDFPGGSVIKNPPAMQKMQVSALGQEDSLEKEMATHFSILASKIP